MATDDRKTVYQSYTESALFKALSPLLYSLKVCGLFHSKEYQWPCQKDESTAGTSVHGTIYKPTFVASQAYAWFVLILV
jgi:hypothetical protein